MRTALEEGLPFEDVAEIEEATKKRKMEVSDINRMNMSKADRLYVYAVASWIATLDGKMSDNEKEALALLGEALGVPEAPRRHADSIMREVAAHSDKTLKIISPRRTRRRTRRKTKKVLLESTVFQAIMSPFLFQSASAIVRAQY